MQITSSCATKRRVISYGDIDVVPETSLKNLGKFIILQHQNLSAQLTSHLSASKPKCKSRYNL